MAITILLPEFLRRYAGGAREESAAGGTVGEALQDLARRYPDLQVRLLDQGGGLPSHLVAFRNGASLPREGAMGTVLGDGDILEIHAAASGG